MEWYFRARQVGAARIQVGEGIGLEILDFLFPESNYRSIQGFVQHLFK